MFSPTSIAQGPGWSLSEGEVGTWVMQFHQQLHDPASTWSQMLMTARSFSKTHGLRPLLVDLRHGPRLAGAATKPAASLFAEFERRSLRVCAVVGPDLIQAARLHRVLELHAPILGRWFVTEAEGVDWVSRGLLPLVYAPYPPWPGGGTSSPPRASMSARNAATPSTITARTALLSRTGS